MENPLSYIERAFLVGIGHKITTAFVSPLDKYILGLYPTSPRLHKIVTESIRLKKGKPYRRSLTSVPHLYFWRFRNYD